MKKGILVLVATLVLPVIGGCEQDGPAERAGEKIDNAAHDVQDAAKDAADKVEDAAE